MSVLISIIIPCYNSAKFISQAIDSVSSQSQRNWELIIVDDNSNDDSGAIIQTYVKQDKRIQYLSLDKNSGAAKARNIGIQTAQGRYIAFLDSDDYWLPDKLVKQLKFMQDNHLALSYASYQLVNETGEYSGEFIVQPNITYADLLKTSCINCSTVMYDSEILTAVAFPEIKGHEDYALWLSILKTTRAVAGILEPLAVYRIVSGSMSNNKFRAALYQWRVYRNFLKLGRVQSLYYFCHYAYFGFFKYR